MQGQLMQLVSSETLLVGHALDNDLISLKMVHAHVLDTAVMYPHPRGPPYKPALKVLAQRYLKRTIQDGEHDSAIDAKAAMDLALLKIKHGRCFGSRLAASELLALHAWLKPFLHDSAGDLHASRFAVIHHSLHDLVTVVDSKHPLVLFGSSWDCMYE